MIAPQDENPLQVKSVPLPELIEDVNNANAHPERSIEAIKDSLKRFGQVEPLIVRKGTNVVIGGNGRLVAMRDLEWEACSVHYFDGTDDEAKALAITLNRSAQFSEFDDETLAAQLEELADADFDLSELGYDEKEFGELIEMVNPTEEIEDVEPQVDRAKELQEQWGTESGQLWIIEGKQKHRLLCGDSTHLQMNQTSSTIRSWVQEPPYSPPSSSTAAVSEWNYLPPTLQWYLRD